MNNMSEVIHERFWSRVTVAQKRRCWPWRGAMDGNGYGQFRMNGKTIRAPRVAFWLRNGRWPNNACHRCDSPSCCNPDHIFNGTRSDNMKDMVAKGRNRTDRGENHSQAVLTDENVLAIRDEYKTGTVSMSALAEKFGCSFSTIQRVITHKTWRHLQ